MRLCVSAVFCAVLLLACGGSAPRDTPTPRLTATTTDTVTRTATPSPTPTPENVYELTEQSRFRLPDGTEEPALGHFVVVPCLSPNTYYAFRITSLTIMSESIMITADVKGGEFEAVTLYFEPAAVSSTTFVIVNGTAGLLTGYGPLDDPPTAETITLELTDGSVSLHMEAQRMGPAYSTGSNYPLCFPYPAAGP